MSGNITSAVTIVQKLSMISYVYLWSGSSPVGTVSVQVSNDYSQNQDGTVKNAGTWNSLPLSAATAVSGNTGNGAIDIDALGFYAIRTVYTFSSGAGTLNCIINAKVS
jgi:hypothetical protein